METVKTSVTKAVKKFEGLWSSSLDDRFAAAKIYFKTITDNGDPETRRLFHESEVARNWIAMRWRVLYLVGKGKLAKGCLDIHNYSMVVSMRNIPLARQEEILANGLRLYSKEHKGGVQVPVRKLNRKIIAHCFDIDTGVEYTPEQQRKKSLGVRSREFFKFVTEANGKVHVSVQHRGVIDANVITEILTYKNDKGASILTSAKLREIADALEK